MHELSVCRGLVRQVEAVAKQHDAATVTRITLRIGPLSGVDKQLLIQAFPHAAVGTIAAAAELVVEAAPIRIHCPSCLRESAAAMNDFTCGVCGTGDTRLVGGDELLLAGIAITNKETLDV